MSAAGRTPLRFVGIDSAYRNTGLVILGEAGRVLERRTLRCTAKTDVEGLLWWEAAIAAALQPGDVVSLEGLSYGSIGRSHILAGVYALWQMQAVRVGRSLFIVPPQRAKIWAVQKAKAEKKEMIAWARPFFEAADGETAPRHAVSEHEADALALALIAQQAYQLGIEVSDTALPAFRLAVLRNAKGDGVVQRPGVSYFRGTYGEGGGRHGG